MNIYQFAVVAYGAVALLLSGAFAMMSGSTPAMALTVLAAGLTWVYQSLGVASPASRWVNTLETIYFAIPVLFAAAWLLSLAAGA